jgi:N-acetylmuramoyl-L-alanine amidase
MPVDYKVKSGDCISSVAFEHGFFWETLWNHSKNSDLKHKRKDPNILKTGDVVYVPDLTLKQESRATEKRHKFKVKGVPAKLQLRLMRPKQEKEEEEPAAAPAGGLGGLGGLAASLPGPLGGGGDSENDDSNLADPDYKPPKQEEEPIKNAPYVFEVDGLRVAEGKTDGDGRVSVPLAPNARVGHLRVHPGTAEEKTFVLALGGVDPLDEVSGVRQRLANLGYFCTPDGPDDADDLRTAVEKFQEQHGLKVNGKIDDDTRKQLKSAHGC